MLVGNPIATGHPNGKVHFKCPGCNRPFAAPTLLIEHIRGNRGHVEPGITLVLFSTCQLIEPSGARFVYVSDLCIDLKSRGRAFSFLGDHTLPQGFPTPVRRIRRNCMQRPQIHLLAGFATILRRLQRTAETAKGLQGTQMHLLNPLQSLIQTLQLGHRRLKPRSCAQTCRSVVLKIS